MVDARESGRFLLLFDAAVFDLDRGFVGRVSIEDWSALFESVSNYRLGLESHGNESAVKSDQCSNSPIVSGEG